MCELPARTSKRCRHFAESSLSVQQLQTCEEWQVKLCFPVTEQGLCSAAEALRPLPTMEVMAFLRGMLARTCCRTASAEDPLTSAACGRHSAVRPVVRCRSFHFQRSRRHHSLTMGGACQNEQQYCRYPDGTGQIAVCVPKVSSFWR